MLLSDLACRSAKTKEKPYKLTDGEGLYLLVHPNGGKYWRMKYRFGGKEKLLSLGRYPDVSLKDAREGRFATRKLLEEGKDPSVKKREEKLIKTVGSANTFKQVASEWHKMRSEEWTARYAKQVMSVLKRDFFPELGNIPITEITPIMLLATLREIEGRGALDAASDARSFAGQIFRYGIATGRAERDIAADLKGALKTQKITHNPHLRIKELPEFLRRLDAYQGPAMAKVALELVFLTLVRTTELRAVTWDEFDEELTEWRISAERMKMRRSHIVPLSAQARQKLAALNVKCRSAVVRSAVFRPNCNRISGHVYDLTADEVPSSAVLPFS